AHPVLARSVAGDLHPVDLQGGESCLCAETLAEGAGKIGHLVERRDALVVQPAEELPGPEGTLSEALDERGKIARRHRAQIGFFGDGKHRSGASTPGEL